MPEAKLEGRTRSPASAPSDSALPDGVVAGDLDWDEVRQVVSHLEELLRSGDPAVIEQFEASAPLLRSAFGQAAALLAEHLQNWDFVRAQEALQVAKRIDDHF